MSTNMPEGRSPIKTLSKPHNQESLLLKTVAGEEESHCPISVVMPVYNGIATLPKSLPALIQQQGARLGKDYEIIVVDDGSNDGSANWIAQHAPEAQLITHDQNKGRIEARLSGIQAARFNRILFIDVRVIAAKHLLTTYWSLGSPSPCMAVPYTPLSEQSAMDRVFHCLRCAYYDAYDGLIDQPRLTITKANFHRSPKGTTALFLDRESYLKALPEHRDRLVNDDTKLFSSMINQGPLYRDRRLKITYLQRSSLREVIPHLFERGILFADYYLSPEGIYRTPALKAGAIIFIAVGVFVWQPVWGVAGLLLIWLAVAGWLAQRLVDVLWLALYLPVLLPTFAAGTLAGIMISACRKQ